jgi:hypothetical protein
MRMGYVIAFVLGGVVSVLLLILYASCVVAGEDDRREGRK